MKPNVVIALILVLTLVTCKDCEDLEEPVLDFSFYTTGEVNYYDRSIKALDLEENILPVEFNGSYPISIVSDTTIYVLFDTANFDTIAISYQRNFEFESMECGVTVTLNSFKLLEESTFDSAVFNILPTSYGRPMDINKNQYIIEIYH